MIEALCERALNRTLTDINLRHKFTFTRAEQSAEALVEDDQTYTLDDDFFAIERIQLLTASTGLPARTLKYIPWQQYQQLVGAQIDKGTPEYWSVRSGHFDETFYVYPIPNSAAAADYTVRATKLRRIITLGGSSVLNNPEDQIDAPEEFGEVLISGAEFYMLFWRERQDRGAWGAALSLYRDKLEQFVPSQEEHQDGPVQFTIPLDTDEQQLGFW